MNTILLFGIGGSLFILALLSAGVLVLINKESRTRMNPADPGTVSATPSWFSKVWKYVLGAVIVIALLYVLKGFVPETPQVPSVDLKDFMPNQFMLGIILIGILAILGATGRGGIAGKAALGFVAIVVIGYLVSELYNQSKYGKDAGIVRETIQERNTKYVLEGITEVLPADAEQKSGQVTTEGLATWEETKDGTILVGVWSDITSVGIGCTVKFTLGGGHKVQYRFYSTEWSDYVRGTSPDASELRFMVTQEGITNLPYIVLCS